jgi:TolA-binding protein
MEVLERYHDLYPPFFRLPTEAEDRIRRLGYAGVGAFQAAHGLKADGILGKKTLEALAHEEENFREILPAVPVRETVQGRFVHDVLFQIAQGLEARGRFREAVRAYQVFLSLYPGHQHSEDALLSIARIFRANDLFAEAASAYSRLMEDYPNGDKTSQAYLEAAGCRELLGEWKAAADHYELYLKKFPNYAGVKDAQCKLAAVRKVMHHADLLADGLPPGKKASALYEMGQVVYKELGSLPKAVGIFAEVADQFPKSYQGPDARFSQGVCLLREGNFALAREAFERLLKDYPDSRLADDARFWIAHTWEYQARAIGRLDFRRVVLKKRSVAEASALRADLDLRRRYVPKAATEGPAWHNPHPDLLKEGQVRDRVREDLVRAVAEYRRVVADHATGDMAQKALLRIGAVSSDYLHDAEKAIEAYRMLLERYPGSTEAVDAQFAVGRHSLKKGDFMAAEKAIAQFLAGFPNHAKAAEALLDLADCHSARKEWQKALDDYQSFLSRWPDSPRAAEVREKAEWIRRYRFE